MLILAPDLHSSYGSLVQKYFVAEGLASGHRVVVVDSDPRNFVRDIMWYPKGSTTAAPKGGSSVGDGAESDDDEQSKGPDQKIKIAWRYEQMKQFQTSVKASSLYVSPVIDLGQGVAERPGSSVYTGLLMIIVTLLICLCMFQTLSFKPRCKRVI